VAGDDSDGELARTNEGVEYGLAEGACSLFRESDIVVWQNTIRRTPTWTMFLYAIVGFRVVNRVEEGLVVYLCA